MASLTFLTAWANAPFAIAAGVVGLFALLQVTGLLGVLAGGESDADVDHDVDHDAHVDADHDADPDAEHESMANGWNPGVLLLPLGVGRIPLSVIWETFALVFAAIGLACNFRYFASGQAPPVHSLLWTLPVSFASAYVGVTLVARALGPVLSFKEHQATGRGDLVGQIGVVISSRVDRDFGEVRIRDRSGHDVRVVCKLAREAKPAVEHESVVVVDYDPAHGEILVEPLDLTDRRLG